MIYECDICNNIRDGDDLLCRRCRKLETLSAENSLMRAMLYQAEAFVLLCKASQEEQGLSVAPEEWWLEKFESLKTRPQTPATSSGSEDR